MKTYRSSPRTWPAVHNKANPWRAKPLAARQQTIYRARGRSSARKGIAAHSFKRSMPDAPNSPMARASAQREQQPGSQCAGRPAQQKFHERRGGGPGKSCLSCTFCRLQLDGPSDVGAKRGSSSPERRLIHERAKLAEDAAIAQADDQRAREALNADQRCFAQARGGQG